MTFVEEAEGGRGGWNLSGIVRYATGNQQVPPTVLQSVRAHEEAGGWALPN